jgi:hypothetical protein
MGRGISSDSKVFTVGKTCGQEEIAVGKAALS